MVVLAVFVTAGCLESIPDAPRPNEAGTPTTFLGEPTPRLPVPDFDFTNAISPDHGGIPHGHGNPLLHTGHFGLELVSYMPLTRPEDGVQTQDVGYTGIDVWGTYACVTQFPGPGGFILVDITDPENPSVLSSAPSGQVNQMCRITDDGEFLLLGAYQGAAEETAPGQAPVNDPGAVGVRVYDIKDKTNPRFLYHDTQGAVVDSTHGMHTLKINETNYVLYSNSAQIWEIGETKLNLVSTMEKSTHDVWAGRHPVTGQWIVVQGNGCNLVIYDITDIKNPIELDEWDSNDDSAYEDACADHWRRQIDHTVGGRAYMVVVGAEMNGPSLPFTVLDFTDPTNIFEVSRWIIPGEPVSPQPNFYTFGGTEYETWNGYVAAGIMHAGVWVFDIGSPERAQEPATMGYYQHPMIPQAEGGTTNKPAPFAPMIWTAAFDDRGYVLSPDTGSGLYILKFQGTVTQ